jgi:hypothetical protein
MVKTIDGITIIGNVNFFTLNNSKNQSTFNFNAKSGSASFRDSIGNTIQNHPATISINFEVFKLTEVGQTINRSNGKVIAYLSSKDVQELAEKNFYEDGQTRIYDFMNQSFTVEL